MAYIGQAPGLGYRNVFRFVAAQGQSTFSGADSNGLVLGYTTNLVDVFVNGSRLSPNDFTATDSATIIIAATLTASDEVLVAAANPWSPANLTTLTQTLTLPGLVSNGYGQDTYANFRAIQGNYGVLLRNDGTTFYILGTASGQATGQWNSFRPFSFNLASGAVTIDATGVGTSFGARPSFAGQTPYDTGNLTAGQIGSILGYTPARPVTPFASGFSNVSDVAVLGSYTYIGQCVINATANNIFASGTCAPYISSGSANEQVNVYVDIYDNTAGAQAAQGVATPFTIIGGNSGYTGMTANVTLGGATIGHQYLIRLWVGKSSSSSVVGVANPVVNGINL